MSSGKGFGNLFSEKSLHLPQNNLIQPLCSINHFWLVPDFCAVYFKGLMFNCSHTLGRNKNLCVMRRLAEFLALFYSFINLYLQKSCI